MISEGAIRACERSFLLSTWMNRNLEETRVPIQVIEEIVSGQSFQHLINKEKGEMIFQGGLIQFPIINAHVPPVTVLVEMSSSCSFLMTVTPPFFRTT